VRVIRPAARPASEWRCLSLEGQSAAEVVVVCSSDHTRTCDLEGYAAIRRRTQTPFSLTTAAITQKISNFQRDRSVIEGALARSNFRHCLRYSSTNA
jgi:hypothetical protein